MNLLYIDFETTGFSKTKHAPVEVACVPVINGENQEVFHSYMMPFKGALVDDEALKINKLKKEQLATFPDPKQVLLNLISYLEGFDCKFTLAAHNAKFDHGFLYMWFCRYGLRTDYLMYFRPNYRCTEKRARDRANYLGVKRFNLKALCKHFSIPLLKAHTALCDTEATVKLDEYLEAIELPSDSSLDLSQLSYRQKREKYLDSSYVQMNPEGGIFIDKRGTDDPKIFQFIMTELWEAYGTVE